MAAPRSRGCALPQLTVLLLLLLAQGSARGDVPRETFGLDVDASAVTASPPDAPPPILLVATLDGRVTALRADSGRELWSLTTGGSLLRVQQQQQQHAPPPGGDDGAPPPPPPPLPLLIPSRDGSILLAAFGPGGIGGGAGGGVGGAPGPGALASLQQLPFSAPELVASRLPFSEGASMLLGSKTTIALQVGLRSGRVLRVVSGAAGVEGAGEAAALGEGEPHVWIGRSDFVVRAFDTSRNAEQWNLTYGELAPHVTGSLGAAAPSIEISGGEGDGEGGGEGGGGEGEGEGGLSDLLGGAPRRRRRSPAEAAAAFLARFALSATMQGQVYCSAVGDAEHSPGSAAPAGWRGPELGAPVSSISLVSPSSARGGAAAQAPLPFKEVWPARRAAATAGSGGAGSGAEEESGAGAGAPGADDGADGALVGGSRARVPLEDDDETLGHADHLRQHLAHAQVLQLKPLARAAVAQVHAVAAACQRVRGSRRGAHGVGRAAGDGRDA